MDFEQATGNFHNWLLEKGVTLSPKVAIADLRRENQGRGVVATEDVKAGEALFEIPRNLLLNIVNGSLASKKEGNLERLQSLGHWQGLILSLLYEMKQPQSKWGPYFAVLPAKMNNLMYWSDRELLMLQPSLVVDRIGREKAEEMYHELFPIVANELADDFGEVSLDEFHHTAGLIMSYSFDVERPDYDEEMAEDEEIEDEDEGYYKSMVMLADTLNADTDLCNANLIHTPDSLVMRATEDIAKGQQVYNTYGDHPNAEILRRYGYVEWNGSQFDFAEIPLVTIVNVFSAVWGQDLTTKILELIQDSEEFDEPCVLEAYDVFADGNLIPELVVLIQILTVLTQTDISDLERTVSRVIKKVMQLVEGGRVTENAITWWKRVQLERIAAYPTHAFRQFRKSGENRVQMAARVLYGEVASLQACRDTFASGFKVIDDAKLMKNINKRPNEDATESNTKRRA